MRPGRPGCLLLLSLAGLALPAQAQADAAPAAHLTGDIGAGFNAAPVAAQAQLSGRGAIPYANFDYGALFARIDTFGARLAPAGYGSVEVVTRFLQDGYTPAATLRIPGQRANSLPLGIGTLQITPVGAFMANLYRDAGKSHGTLLDLMAAAEIDHGAMAWYPQAGLEYRSASYVRYYNGVSAFEQQVSGVPAYTPGAACNPFAALFAEAHMGGHWYLDANLRRTWLSASIRNSPLVRRRTLDTALLALSYRFD